MSATRPLKAATNAPMYTASTADRAVKRFCVVVHDVAPVWRPEVNQILDQVSPLLGRALAGAIVPCWHGAQPDSADRLLIQDWARQFGECLLHGWTHQRQGRAGIISWLTGRSDEFSGLNSEESRQRVEQAQSQVESILGSKLRGFVAPAWQLPAGLAALQPAGIEYRLGFSRLERVSAAPVRLATWSWDWGWLPGSGRGGALLGAWQHAWCRDAVPVIVLHPLDVRRGHLRRATRLIKRFATAGWTPVLPSDVANGLMGGPGA